jgi:hypothetical protein
VEETLNTRNIFIPIYEGKLTFVITELDGDITRRTLTIRAWKAEESPLLEVFARERLVKTAGWKMFGVCCCDL